MACKCCFVLVLVAVFYEWEAERGPLSGWELIERVDGFHPNQVCAPMISSGNQRTTEDECDTHLPVEWLKNSC